MNNNDSNNAVYERLLHHCIRFEFDGELEFLMADDDAFRTPLDTETVWSDLQRTFSAEQLIGAGVGQFGDAGTLELAEAVAEPNMPIIALRGEVHAAPFDLLSGHGCLSGHPLPIVAMLGDSRTAKMIESTIEGIVVTSSVDSAILFRALGLPATTSPGLQNINQKTLDELRRHIEVEVVDHAPQCDESTVEAALDILESQAQDPIRLAFGGGVTGTNTDSNAAQATVPSGRGLEFKPRLILAFWAIGPRGFRDEQDQLDVVVRSLREIEENVEATFDDVDVWSPTSEDGKRFEFCLKRSALDWLRNALFRSFDQSTHSLSNHGKRPVVQEGPPDSYPLALQEFQRWQRGEQGACRSEGGEKQAWRDVERFLEKDLISALVREASFSMDPLERNLLLANAQISRLFHMYAVRTAARLSNVVADTGVHRSESNPREDLLPVLASADRILALTKEIHRCRQEPTITAIVTANENSLTLPVSGLPRTN